MKLDAVANTGVFGGDSLLRSSVALSLSSITTLFTGVQLEVELDSMVDAVIFEGDDVFEGSLALTLEHNLVGLTTNVGSDEFLEVA
jgi:hypothetical protein